MSAISAISLFLFQMLCLGGIWYIRSTEKGEGGDKALVKLGTFAGFIVMILIVLVAVGTAANHWL